jgi:hypothetical protein
MAAVTFPIILLRFISRRIVSNMIGWDDWAVGLAAVRLTTGEGCCPDVDFFEQLIMIPMTIIPIISTATTPLKSLVKMLTYYRCQSRLWESLLECPC